MGVSKRGTGSEKTELQKVFEEKMLVVGGDGDGLRHCRSIGDNRW